MSGLVPIAEKINAALLSLSSDIEANRLQLPSPPDNLITLRELIQHDAEVTEVATLLSKEPHISARLIKLANSVLFNSRFHVSSVKSAITRLGMQKVSNLVTGFAITQSFINSKTKGIERYLNRSWLISNHVAAITMSLARHHGHIDPDQALLAGQIHNIGDTPLLLHINTLTELNNNPDLKNKVISMVLKKLSAKVGSAILKKWQFPTDMVRLPFAVESSKIRPQTPIQLEHLVNIATTLRTTDFTVPVNQLPHALIESPVFELIWGSEETAINQLNSLADDILSMQRLLRST
jgi:HD-like signal output (HDOD) protein